MKKAKLTKKHHRKMPKKQEHHDKPDVGEDFVASDGGCGWVVCKLKTFAGSSLTWLELWEFCLFPPLQQFGLIYRERMKSIGFEPNEITAIVNVLMAISSLVGIINGALFRRFTFRQVALAGSFLSVIGLLFSAFCTTFLQYLISFSCFFGIGLGFSTAAVSLAVNMYFKQIRRRATGFSWTITGIWPIVFPHVSTFLLGYYGIQSTILIFAVIALNAVVCGMTLQPVLRLTRKPPRKDIVVVAATTSANEGDGNDSILEEETNENMLNASEANDALNAYECEYCQYMKHKRRIFSSQYLFNNDDPERPGYEITEPGTSMLARDNDVWYGSIISLASDMETRLRVHSLNQTLRSRENFNLDSGECHKPNYFNREREDNNRITSKVSLSSETGECDERRCTFAEEKALPSKSGGSLSNEKAELMAAKAAEEEARSKMTFCQKLVKVFDLNLLTDFTFMNLALGMAIMLFGEMNFSVLTPIILNDFGYTDGQISLATSLLTGVDIILRFLAPFTLEEVKLGNRVLFAAGNIAITLGGFVVTATSSYEIILISFVLIGVGKACASGLQLVINGMFYFLFGPILGITSELFK